MKGFSKLQWMDAVRHCTDIPAEQRLVIEDIGSTADQDGANAWRDNKSVAEKLRVHPRTVTRARESASRCRLWVETRPADNKHTARYRLTMPAGWGDSTVNPNGLGVTAQSAWGDSTVQLGRQHSPVGVTPLSTASGSSSVNPSGSSSVGGDDTYAANPDPWGDPPDKDKSEEHAA
jgi:hypothetical protein